jgi:hypothetical protein
MNSLNIQRLVKQLAENHEAFASGLGKNVKCKTTKHNTQKQKVVRKKKFHSYNHGKRTEIFTQSLSDLYNGIGLPGSFKADIDNIKKDVDRIVAPLEDLTDLLTSDGISRLIENITKMSTEGVPVNHKIQISEDLLFFLSLLVLIGGFSVGSKSLQIMGMIGSVISITNMVSDDGIGGILKYLCTMIKESGKNMLEVDCETYHDAMHTQSLDHSLVFRMIVIAVSGFMITKNYGSVGITSLSKIDKIAKTMTPIILLMRGGDDILGSIMTFLEKIINITGKFFDEDFSFSLKGEVWYDFEIIRRRLRSLQSEFEMREDLGGVARKARALKADLEALKIPKEGAIYTQYRDLSNAVSILSDDLARFGAVGNSIRKEPFCIIISGPPGVGKSNVSKNLLDLMAKHILIPCAFENYTKCEGAYIFNPNQQEKFVSGYTNQKFVVVDDLGYSAESVETMLPRFIAMVNSMPYNVEQAELARKGAVYFDSEMILCTSNIHNWAQAADKMTSTDALCRRMHFTIWCECKPEFAKETVDEAGELQLDPSKVLDWNSCEWLNFYVYDPTGKMPKRPMCRHGIKCKFDTTDCSHACMADVIVSSCDEYDERANRHNMIMTTSRDKFMAIKEHSNLNARELAHYFHGKTLRTQARCVDHCVLCQDLNKDKLNFMYQGCVRYWEDEMNGICPCGDKTHSSDNFNEFIVQLQKLVIDEPEYFRKKYFMKCFTEIQGFTNCMFEGAAYLYVNMLSYESRQESLKFSIEDFLHKSKVQILDSVDYIRNCSPKIKEAFKTIKEYTLGDWAFKILSILRSPITIGIISTSVLALMSIGCFNYFKGSSNKQLLVNDFSTQSVDMNSMDLMRSFANHNVMHVYQAGTYWFTVTGIGSNLILINKHVIDKLYRANPEELELRRIGKRSNQWTLRFKLSQIDKERIFHLPECDLACLEIPGLNCVDISKYASDTVITSRNVSKLGLAYYNPNSEMPEYNIRIGGSLQPMRIDALDYSSGKRYLTVRTVSYEIATEIGMCGAPAFAFDKNVERKFLGIHCAGDGTMGVAVRVTKSMLEDCFSHFTSGQFKVQSNVVTLSKENIFYGEMPIKMIPDCQVIGRVNAPATTLKSEICKSPLYKRIPGFAPNKMPAILVPTRVDGVLTCPIEKNISAYARGFIVPEKELFEGSVLAYIDFLKRNTNPPRRTAFISFEEAVQGCDDLPNVKSINRGTSGGYPDKLYLKTKKRTAFGFDENFTYDTKEAKLIRKTVEEAMLALEDGPVEMIANIFPKDELRPIAKAKALKTRLIAGFSCHTTILGRMIFAPLLDWFSDEKNRIRNGSAVGVNVASFEWERIARLHGLGDPNIDVKAGDYSSFDKSMSPFFMEIPFRVWQEFFAPFLTEREVKIATNCWKSLMKAHVVCKDNLIAWGNSNASGNFATTMINCMANHTALINAITGVLKPHIVDRYEVVKLWRDIRDEINITVYGDDNIWSVNTESKILKSLPTLTYENVGEALSKIGFVYTDEDKSATFNEQKRNIFEVSFLKRKFVLEEGKILAPLALDTIMQNIQWSKKKDFDNVNFFDKVDTFLCDLSVHDKDTYDKHSSLILETLDQCVPNHPVMRSLTQRDRRQRGAIRQEPL